MRLAPGVAIALCAPCTSQGPQLPWVAYGVLEYHVSTPSALRAGVAAGCSLPVVHGSLHLTGETVSAAVHPHLVGLADLSRQGCAT